MAPAHTSADLANRKIASSLSFPNTANFTDVNQHHKITNLYFDQYVNEASYREDSRKQSNGAIFGDITLRCAKAGVSRNFCGYWQGSKKLRENLEA